MFFRQPNFYGDFRCIGGTCGITCCANWNIAWDKDEVDKILNAPNCPADLHDIVEKTIIPDERNEGKYKVDLDGKKNCPILTEDGFCRIQRELGAEYLSFTCMIYPRLIRLVTDGDSINNSTIYRTCRLSCPEVTKRIITDKKAMNLLNVTPKAAGERVRYACDTEEKIQKHPEYLFRGNLFEMYYTLISDKRLSPEMAISIGSMATGLLQVVIAEGDFGEIGAIINDVTRGGIRKTWIPRINNIASSYDVKLKFLGSVMDYLFANNSLQSLKKEDGEFDIERFEKAEKKIEKIFGDDTWRRNIALDLLFEFSIPFYSEEHPIFESYSLFLASFAIIKLNATAAVAELPDTIDEAELKAEGIDIICHVTAKISRNVCQNVDKANTLIKILKELNLLTPASIIQLMR